MSQLRYNPLLRTYTMVAANRQNRPHMPKDWCPFCIGSGRVPDQYDVLVYDNDYPVLSPDYGTAGLTEHPAATPYHQADAYGHCEVILYSSDHNASLHQLSVEHITKLVHLWKTRFLHYRQDERVKYIYPFENRGEEVGVTMPHPHGQLYAYPFVPLKIKTELDSCRHYFAEHHRCLLCDMNATELEDGRRIIAQNNHFVAYLPHFTDYPFGVFVVAKQHIGSFAQFDDATAQSLAKMLKEVTGAFDKIYDRPFPYMMCIHQTPVNSTEYADSATYYHFHIEFYPPLRDRDKVKWYASSEMGAWAAANVVAVEQTAVVLRDALMRYRAEQTIVFEHKGMQLLALPLSYLQQSVDAPNLLVQQLGLPAQNIYNPEHWVTILRNEIIPEVAANPQIWQYYTRWLVIDTALGAIVCDMCLQHGIDKTGSLEFGYGVNVSYEGQGYTTRAVACLVQWATQDANIKRLIAETNRTNIASIRVLEKNGFRCYEANENSFWWELVLD